MTNDQIVAVGVLLVISTLFSAIIIAPYTFSNYPGTAVMIYVLYWVVLIVLGGFMAIKPLFVARIILPNTEKSSEKTSWSIDEFQAVLFSAIGLYIFTITITHLDEWIRAWDIYSDYKRTGEVIHQNMISTYGTLIFRLAVSIWLLLGAKGLRGVIRYLRNL